MTQMNVLIDLLNAANIPFELTADACGNPSNQVWYPDEDDPVCDVICHQFSYGGDRGLLEIMSLNENYNNVEGFLTAEEVFKRIKADYEKSKVDK